MNSFAQTYITFTVELSILDLFLKTVHWGHASESTRRRWEKSCFLRVISCFPFLNFVKTKVSWERQSYKDMLRVRDYVGAASALLASACVPSYSQCGLGRCSIWASFWRGACVRALGYRSRSVQARGLNSAATRASGVLGGINHWQWLARSVMLACPCWPLEGLLFATQKTCLRKS